MKHEDLFHDIAIGITSIQSLDSERTKTLGNKKNIHPKTNILNVIHNITTPIINDIKNDYSWKYETEFITNDNTHIKIIDYPCFTDWCIISMDHNKSIKVNKKYVNELYRQKIII